MRGSRVPGVTSRWLEGAWGAGFIREERQLCAPARERRVTRSRWARRSQGEGWPPCKVQELQGPSDTTRPRVHSWMLKSSTHLSKGLKSRATLSRSVHIAEGPHPERSGRSTLSEHGVSAAPSASLLKQPATLSQEEKEAIQSVLEGRAKVPPKFRDSIKRFFAQEP